MLQWNSIKNTFFNRDAAYIIIGLLIIFIALFPFWYFGEYSSLGWYDEVDGMIPWNFMSLNYPSVFYHSFSGGIHGLFGGDVQLVFLFYILQFLFTIQKSALIVKVLSLISFFCGFYWLSKNVFKSAPVIAFSVSLFALFSCYIPYGWVLGGHGFDLSITIFFALAVFGSFKRKYTYLSVGLSSILIGVSMSQPLFLIPFISVFCLFIYISNKNKDVSNKDILFRFLVLFFILLFLDLFNGYKLYYTTFGATDFSTRLLGCFNAVNNDDLSLVDLIMKNYNDFTKWLSRFSNGNIIPGAIVVFVLSVYKKRFLPFILLLFVGYLTPLFLEVFFEKVKVTGLSTYRWNIIWILIPLMISSCIAIILNNKNSTPSIFHKIITLVVSGVLFFYTSIGAEILVQHTMSWINLRGGAGVSFHYSELNQIKNKDQFRVVSDYSGIQWATPIYYGFSTLDGSQSAAPHRRTYYLAYGLAKEPQEKYHHTKHFFNFYDNNAIYNPKFFRMANVEYIFSPKPKIEFPVKKIMSIKGKKFSELKKDNSINSFLIEQYGDIKLVNDLNIYQLDSVWSYVFAANSSAISAYSFKEKPFYNDLKDIDKHSILIAKDDYEIYTPKTNSYILKIDHFQKTEQGMKVYVSEGTGYVVFNQVYNPYWRAIDDHGNELNLIPVNGIMMAAEIIDSVKSVEFIHQ